MEVTLLLLVATGAALALASLRRVPEDTVCTVHRGGRYVRTLKPGIRFTIPLVDKIAHRVRLVGHHVDLPGSRGEVYYQILEPELARDVLDDVDALVQREAHERLAELVATPAEAEALDGRLKQDLNRELGRLGLRVTRCRVRLPAAA